MKTASTNRKIALSTLLLGIVTMSASPSWADNPIVQTYFTADPAPVVYGERLYLYTSHDEDVTKDNFYTMNDWRLYSTVDMVNWTDHGSPAGYKTFSWGTGDAWAPQGIERNGKYYLFVPLNNATGARIGVGVANNPAGPFMDPLGKALAASGDGNIDPTVFIDDDDQAYMYWGNGTLRYVKLNSDMTSYTGAVTNVSLSGFVEGPWLSKRGSLYYMTYAAGPGGNEKISYATSNSPTGPWTTRGDVMDSGSTFTNHAGVIDFKGHSYFFYHNSVLGGTDFKRSVCVEEFTYGSDGGIPKLTMSTTGPKGIATLNPFQQVEAETIAYSSGLKTEVCTDTGAGINVSSIGNGDYIKVKDVDFLDGITSFDARVSSAGGNAKIELRLDSKTGTLLGTCDVSGASSWSTKSCAVTGATGKHDLFLVFTGGSGDLFKFNWWKFSGPSGGSGTGGAGGVAGAAGSAGGGSGGATGGGLGGTSGGGIGGTANAAGGTIGTTGGRVGGDAGSVAASGGGAGGGGGSVAGGGRAGGGTPSATGGLAGGSVSQRGGSGGSGGVPISATGGAGVAPAASSGSQSSSCSYRAGTSRGDRGLSGAPWLAAFALLLFRRRSS